MGRNWGVIFCHQTLLIKCPIYFDLSADLGVPLFYRLREKPGFLHSKCLSHRCSRCFVCLRGRLHRFLQRFLHSKYLSQRCESLRWHCRCCCCGCCCCDGLLSLLSLMLLLLLLATIAAVIAAVAVVVAVAAAAAVVVVGSDTT